MCHEGFGGAHGHGEACWCKGGPPNEWANPEILAEIDQAGERMTHRMLEERRRQRVDIEALLAELRRG